MKYIGVFNIHGHIYELYRMIMRSSITMKMDKKL